MVVVNAADTQTLRFYNAPLFPTMSLSYADREVNEADQDNIDSLVFRVCVQCYPTKRQLHFSDSFH